MNFRTEIEPLPLRGLLCHGAPIVMLGSCFSDEIGLKLRSDGFNVVSNLFGPIYSASAMLRVLKWVTSDDGVRLFQYDGLYRSFLAHTKLSSSDSRQLEVEMLERRKRLLNSLRTAQAFIITLGSARTFYMDGEPVVNCHKLPANKFDQRMASPAEIDNSIEAIYNLIREINPGCRFVVTISPVRHGGYGAHGNQISKASLLLGINEFMESYPDVIYFPAFEYLLDDLRDYRFYASDFKHPSEIAVNYIYNKFSESFFDNHTLQISKEFHSLFLRLNHKNLLATQPELERQNVKLKEDVRILCEKYPELNHINFDSLKC